MASIAFIPLTMELSTADNIIFHCCDLRSRFHFSLCRPRKTYHFASLNSSTQSRLRWAELPKPTGRSSIEEEEKEEDKEGSEDSADLLQNTIEKSQKVISVQKELLQKIAERRKLVSSIKSNILAPYSNGDTVNDVDADHDNQSSNLSTKDGHSRDNALSETMPEADSGDFSERKENPIVTKFSMDEKSSNQRPSFLSNPVSKIPILENERDKNLEEWSLPEVIEEDIPSMKEDLKPPPPLAGTNAMNVILVAAECSPWAKTGGLGDVVGALPKALARRGHRVMSIEVTYFHAYIDGVDFVFIESPTFRHMGNNIYGGNGMDILKRMVVLCKAAIEVPWYVPCGGVCYGDGNLVFIANDWHTALLPVYLKAYYRDKGLMKYTRSILVIHNIAFQGRGPMTDFMYVDLPEHYKDIFRTYDPVGGEHLNIFAAGLKCADRVITVSRGYEWEIKTLEGGWGLHGLINENNWKLRGIVNGIDTHEWNPRTDAHLASDGYSHYSLETFRSEKPKCKRALQKELGLPVRDDVVLIGFIGRLDPQKGIDLIAEAVPFLMGQEIQLVMLGSGRLDYENMLRRFERENHHKVRGWVGFSVKMAHRITAGADALLMPSRFEPCGLNQLYAMRYGTVPVVHAVGGLRETVRPFDPFGETGLGWTFDGADVGRIIRALENCILTYREYRESWEGIQRRGMMQDLSWDNAAKHYEEVLVAAKYQW